MENTWRNTRQSRGVALCPPMFWQRHIGNISNWAVKQIMFFSEIVQVCPQALARNWLPKPLKTSMGFPDVFPFNEQPLGPSPKSCWEKTPPHLGVDWAQGGPFLPDVPRFFVDQKSIEPYYFGAILQKSIDVPGGPWPFPALSTQDRDGNISYREFVPFAFDLLQKMASSGPPKRWRSQPVDGCWWFVLIYCTIIYQG